MRVLIGTDGSEDAISAASDGLALLAPPETITIVCVIDTPGAATAGMESGFAGGMVSETQVDAAWSAAEAEAAEAIDATIAALSTDATIERVTTPGDAGQVLCRLAEELDIDVVIVGSRGRGAIKRALLGSVSSHVTNNAPCPVVIVRAGIDD